MENSKPVTTYSAVLGRVLTYYRDQMKLEQADVANNLGMSQSAWSRIERGDSNISAELLNRAATVLGVKASKILEDTEASVEALQEKSVSVASSKSENTGDLLLLLGLAAITAVVVGVIAKKG